MQIDSPILPTNIESNMQIHSLSSHQTVIKFKPCIDNLNYFRKIIKNRGLLVIYSKFLGASVNPFPRRSPTILTIQFPRFTFQYPFSNKNISIGLNRYPNSFREKGNNITYHFAEFNTIQIRQVLLYPDENISILLTHTCHPTKLQGNWERFTPLVMSK